MRMDSTEPPTFVTKNGLFLVRLNIVDVLSISGLVCALCSIALMIEQQFDLGLSMLLAAVAIDFLDGPFARKLGTLRAFGRYLDSFIDVIDYLITPVLFIYLQNILSPFLLVILALFVVSGVVRLSVFNSIGNIKNKKGQSSYLGMPVYWSVYFLALYQVSQWISPTDLSAMILICILAAQTILMNVGMTFHKFQDWRKIGGFTVVLSVIFALKHFSII